MQLETNFTTKGRFGTVSWRAKGWHWGLLRLSVGTAATKQVAMRAAMDPAALRRHAAGRGRTASSQSEPCCRSCAAQRNSSFDRRSTWHVPRGTARRQRQKNGVNPPNEQPQESTLHGCWCERLSRLDSALGSFPLGARLFLPRSGPSGPNATICPVFSLLGRGAGSGSTRLVTVEGRSVLRLRRGLCPAPIGAAWHGEGAGAVCAAREPHQLAHHGVCARAHTRIPVG